MPSHIIHPSSIPYSANTTRMTCLRVLSRGKLVLHMKEDSFGVWKTIYEYNGKKKAKKNPRKGRGLVSKMWKKHKRYLNR